MAAPQTEPGTDLPPILQAVSRELTSLGDMGCVLQSVFSSLATAHARLTGEPDTPGSAHIQALDVFTQRLFVLADFLAALAPTVTPGSRGDLGRALAGVTLADVAERLAADPQRAAALVDAGALELFGDDP